jgi:hypothetical protein
LPWLRGDDAALACWISARLGGHLSSGLFDTADDLGGVDRLALLAGLTVKGQSPGRDKAGAATGSAGRIGTGGGFQLTLVL